MRNVIDHVSTGRRGAAILRLGVALALLPGPCACGATAPSRAPEPPVATEAQSRPADEEPPEVAATPEPEEAPGAATSAEPVFVEAGTNNSLGGFDTISVDLGGVVTLHRSELGHTHWRRATIRLSPEQLFAITDAIDSDQLYWFGGSYHAGRELGEPMFTLRLINGDTETAIFCDDACPRRVYAFYQELNRIVEEAGRDGYGWRSVPGSGHGDALLEAGRRAQRNPRRLNDPRLWR